jgi:hypothetical protein
LKLRPQQGPVHRLRAEHESTTDEGRFDRFEILPPADDQDGQVSQLGIRLDAHDQLTAAQPRHVKVKQDRIENTARQPPPSL